MRRLKPSIDALNEKYADDREKKGAAMMALYKEHKINPFGGCLPQLLQLPVWWALYTSLSTNVELFKRPFFGFWQDLAAPDPYYALPLALGVLMWIQQKITPSTMDPAQAKMMLYVMPAMITSFMLFLPAGLCLYMFTNSVLSIGQQRFIEYRLAHKQAAVPAASATNVGGTDSPSGASNDAASPRRTGRGRA
jgi:YidC/Oxa1 family membrane protein insertase